VRRDRAGAGRRPAAWQRPTTGGAGLSPMASGMEGRWGPGGRERRPWRRRMESAAAVGGVCYGGPESGGQQRCMRWCEAAACGIVRSGGGTIQNGRTVRCPLREVGTGTNSLYYLGCSVHSLVNRRMYMHIVLGFDTEEYSTVIFLGTEEYKKARNAIIFLVALIPSTIHIIIVYY
jgi:hypothetical protein